MATQKTRLSEEQSQSLEDLKRLIFGAMAEIQNLPAFDAEIDSDSLGCWADDIRSGLRMLDRITDEVTQREQGE